MFYISTVCYIIVIAPHNCHTTTDKRYPYSEQLTNSPLVGVNFLAMLQLQEAEGPAEEVSDEESCNEEDKENEDVTQRKKYKVCK